MWRRNHCRFCALLASEAEAMRGKVVSIQLQPMLSHATLQQRLTVVRLFGDFLVEERLCPKNQWGEAGTR